METTLKFKTSINCGSCVAKVTPRLNEADFIESWDVDTKNPDKILTVHLNPTSPDASSSAVEALIKGAGFNIKWLMY